MGFAFDNDFVDGVQIKVVGIGGAAEIQSTVWSRRGAGVEFYQ